MSVCHPFLLSTSFSLFQVGQVVLLLQHLACFVLCKIPFCCFFLVQVHRCSFLISNKCTVIIKKNFFKQTAFRINHPHKHDQKDDSVLPIKTQSDHKPGELREFEKLSKCQGKLREILIFVEKKNKKTQGKCKMCDIIANKTVLQ